MPSSQPKTPLGFIKSISQEVSEAKTTYVRQTNASFAPGGAHLGVIESTPVGLKKEATKAGKEVDAARAALLRNPALGHKAEHLVQVGYQIEAYRAALETLSEARDAIVESARWAIFASGEEAHEAVHEEYIKHVLETAQIVSGRSDMTGGFAVADFIDNLNSDFKEAQKSALPVPFTHVVEQAVNKSLATVDYDTNRYEGLIAQRVAFFERVGPAKTFVASVVKREQEQIALGKAANLVRNVWRSALVAQPPQGYENVDFANLDNEALDAKIEEVVFDAARELEAGRLQAREDLGIRPPQPGQRTDTAPIMGL